MSLIPFDAIESACNLYPEIADNLDLFEDFVALTDGELTTEYKNAFSLWLSQCPIKNHHAYIKPSNAGGHGGNHASIH